ncbi:unnamed protein product [Staurois parvus]|uniref:Uncharacterized protein n=1 Tax=Staurois parvus TaxID=386267 RepID=A0ABN9FSV0_9NEOB|nr:unnamed protein product [Staurois parvus]
MGWPYSTLLTKWTSTSSVRRPKSGTWQSVAMEKTAAMGGRTGTHGPTPGPGSSMRRRYRGPMTDYGPGSSDEESVGGPM